jgi:pimeloyl-ACP methyl ester carboxylesterase
LTIKEETRRANGLKPHLVGFSMGGTLTTVVAEEDLVDRVVLLAPFYAHASGDSLIHFGCTVFEPFLPVIPKPWRGSIADPALYGEYFPGTWYVSLGAVRRLEELAERARAAAPSLARPTLLLGSANDFVASFEVSQEIFSGNRNVTIHEFPRSDHILLYDYDRAEVVRMVVEFLTAD